MNCYKNRKEILGSDLFEIMKQPPFPGLYKTKDGVDLETLRELFHSQYREEPISIMRFLDFIADLVKDKGGKGKEWHGEGGGLGSYGHDD
jgi:hypothetical protein